MISKSDTGSNKTMYHLIVSEQLDKKLLRLGKKYPKQVEILWKKVKEIVHNPSHYKPMRKRMKGQRRVHIDKHFVLTFEILEDEKAVRLLDFDHHEKIYFYLLF